MLKSLSHRALFSVLGDQTVMTKAGGSDETNDLIYKNLIYLLS